MKVRELIAELAKFDLEMEVQCSIDCDTMESVEGRRIFGRNCRGVNPHFNDAVLLFDLEEINFDTKFLETLKHG